MQLAQIVADFQTVYYGRMAEKNPLESGQI
jgi:hypothetical protein